MMESLPQARSSFQKALADVKQRESKARSAGKAALSHAEADLRAKLGASKTQARALMLQARRDTIYAAVAAESHAKQALDAAKAKLATLQQVPHDAPQEEVVLKMPPLPHEEAVEPPLPPLAEAVEPTRTVEPLAVDVAAKMMVEGELSTEGVHLAAPQLPHKSKPDTDFERLLAHPGEHFHP